MAIPDFKDIVDLVKKGATVEAQEKVMELREAVLELQEQNLQLRTRLGEIEAKQKSSSKMRFQKPFYFKDPDSQPFCPLCWEKDELEIHLIGPYEMGDGDYYRCDHCKSKHKIKDRPPRQAIFTRG